MISLLTARTVFTNFGYVSRRRELSINRLGLYTSYYGLLSEQSRAWACNEMIGADLSVGVDQKQP